VSCCSRNTSTEFLLQVKIPPSQEVRFAVSLPRALCLQTATASKAGASETRAGGKRKEFVVASLLFEKPPRTATEKHLDLDLRAEISLPSRKRPLCCFSLARVLFGIRLRRRQKQVRTKRKKRGNGKQEEAENPKRFSSVKKKKQVKLRISFFSKFSPILPLVELRARAPSRALALSSQQVEQ